MIMSPTARRELLASATEFAVAAANSSLPKMLKNAEFEGVEILQDAMRDLMREVGAAGTMTRNKETGVFAADIDAVDIKSQQVDPAPISHAYMAAIEAHVAMRDPLIEADKYFTNDMRSYFENDVDRHVTLARSSEIQMLSKAAEFAVYAANSGVSSILSRDIENGDNPELGQMAADTRNVVAWMWRAGVITKETEDSRVAFNPDTFTIATTRKDVGDVLSTFDSAIFEHYKHANTLRDAGFGEYVDGLIDKRLLDPQNPWAGIMDVRDQRAHAVTMAALSAVDALAKTPEEVPFAKGIDSDAHASLIAALSAAGYLVPGDNPMRTEPLSQQSPRGSLEAFGDIHVAAAQMVANYEPRTTADNLKEAALHVTLGEMKEAVKDYGRGVYDAPTRTNLKRNTMMIQGDLMPGSAELTYNVFEAFYQLDKSAQEDPGDIHSVQVPTRHMRALQNAIAAYDDDKVTFALNDGDLNIPGISPKTAKNIDRTVTAFRDGIEIPDAAPSHAADEIDGDDADEFAMYDETLAAVFDPIKDESDRKEEILDIIGADGDGGRDGGKSSRWTTITRNTLDDFKARADDILQTGAITALAVIAGIDDEKNIGAMTQRTDLASYGSASDAMFSSKKRADSNIEKVSENMSWAAFQALNPKTRTKIPAVVKFHSSNGVFRDMPASFGVAAEKKVDHYIFGKAGKALSADEKTSSEARKALRAAENAIIVAPTERDAAAFRAASEKFNAAERKSVKMAMERKAQPVSLREAAFATTAVADMLDTISLASQGSAPRRQDIAVYAFAPKGGRQGGVDNKDAATSSWGPISLVHEDAPMISVLSHNLPNPLDKKSQEKADRTRETPKPKLLGHIPVAMLQEAVRVGRDQTVINFNELTPVSAASRATVRETEKEAAAAKKPARKRYDQITLS